MLSPEVWNFEPPQCNISIKEGSKEIFPVVWDDLVLSHYFNHSISIVLPDTESVPVAESEGLTNNADYYKVKSLPVREFIDKEFVDAFIKSGRVTALSIGTHIDTDDCAAITPSGDLLLSVCREIYQTLGIEGKPSALSGKHPERYVINISLKSGQFSWKNAQYSRLRKCLTENVELTMNFIITWDPPDNEICPSSIAAFFKERGYSVNLCSPHITSRIDNNIRVPPLSVDHMELLEWLGAYTVGVNVGQGKHTNKELSSFNGAEKGDVMNVSLLKCEGLFTTLQIYRLIERLRTYAEKQNCAPWVSIHVQGYADAPVSWNLKEHHFYMNGINQYTLFLQPDGSFLYYKVSTSHKKLK